MSGPSHDEMLRPGSIARPAGSIVLDLGPQTLSYLYAVIQTGRIQDLRILRRTNDGLILGDDDDPEVLLPALEVEQSDEVEEMVRVFVHHDKNGGLLATRRTPKAQVGEFAPMKMLYEDRNGAYMDWGLEPELLVPHTEQQRDLLEEKWYVVRVALNDDTGRIYGSTFIERFLDNSTLTVEEGEKVELVVFGRSELGLSVAVNHAHQGLVHANEVFKHVSVGDRIPGYVKKIREDNKLDITLQPIGYRQYNDVNTTLLAKRLQGAAGQFLPYTDKSSAEEIYEEFGISKKAFKKALGALYKDRKVRIGEEGIKWIAK
jgi:uncharacterized protein